jgi:hypothetical protein
LDFPFGSKSPQFSAAARLVMNVIANTRKHYFELYLTVAQPKQPNHLLLLIVHP